MSKFIFVVLILVVAAVGAITFYYRSQEPVDAEINLALFQQDVALKAQQLTDESRAPLPEYADWLKVLAPLSKQYQLDITIVQSTPRQLDIAVNDADYEHLVNACAELYASGLRFQSVRLLKADQPGRVNAEALNFIR